MKIEIEPAELLELLIDVNNSMHEKALLIFKDYQEQLTKVNLDARNIDVEEFNRLLNDTLDK